MKRISIGSHAIGSGASALLIAGPCVIESEKHCILMARRLKQIAHKSGIPFVFKASYDKANRMSLDSFRGPGLKKGLAVLQKVKTEVGVPVLSDVHSCAEIPEAARVLDIIQIPALLCRQTDLVVAAAKTGRIVNIKKGQFIAPWDMLPIIKKAESTGNRRIIITERGYSFGYNNLVTDFRSLAILRSFGYPVIYDATHSVQLPGGKGNCSSGQREFVTGLSRAAVAFGCDGLFLEVHDHPDKALCDGPNMIDLKELKKLLDQTMSIRKSL
jgi:2-dehydro-3-deoxyphosphooctonate aldolase (KDO 8-P synthase)